MDDDHAREFAYNFGTQFLDVGLFTNLCQKAVGSFRAVAFSDDDVLQLCPVDFQRFMFALVDSCHLGKVGFDGVFLPV